MKCYTCDEQETQHHIELYTIGSEGTRLCNDCRNILTEFCRTMQRINSHRHFKKDRDSS